MRLFFVIIFLVSSIQLKANGKDSTVHYKARKIVAWSLNTTGAVGVHAVLYKTWYSSYPQSRFHWINDNNEWLQMDKFGHAWSAATIAANTAEGFQWAGYNKRKSAVLGSATALLFQYTIEYFDGHSAAWGASKGDLAANTVGIIYAGVQRYIWGKCRIPFMFSFHTTKFENIRPELLGHGLPESILKDYNGQTYWIDLNPTRMLIRPRWWPKFLGISVGYGVEGLVGGDDNVWEDKNKQTFARNDIKRYRQLFITPSFSFAYTHSKYGWVRALAWLSDHVHLPLPTFEFTSNNTTSFHWLYW